MPQSAKDRPPPLRRHHRDRVTLYVNDRLDVTPALDALYDLPEILEGLPGRSTRQRGRATAWRWQPDRGPELAVRLYAHGGLLGPLLGTLYLGPQRMLSEFRVHLHAARSGVPTSPPVALRIQRVFGPLVRAHYLSVALPGTRNLLDFIKSQPQAIQSLTRRRQIASAVAGAVADLHDAGILHADLSLGNVLVREQEGGAEAFIIDFDKSQLVDSLSLTERMRNLLRLDRSVLKWPASRRAVGPLDRLRVLRFYLDRYPEWRRRWGEIARNNVTSHGLHRLTRRHD